MLKRVVNVVLLDHEILEVKFGNTLGELEKFSKNINTSADSTITKVSLQVNATQSYLSGAELQLTMNGHNLPVMRWNAFENFEKKLSLDVTSLLLLGSNTFNGIYRTAFGVLNDNKLDLTMVLNIEVNVPNTQSPGVDAGPTKSDDTWKNIVRKLKESLTYVIVLSILGIALVAGIYVVQRKAMNTFKV